MINPTAFVPVPIDSRDAGVQTDGAPGARCQRFKRGALVILLLACSTILVELLRWGIQHLTAGGSTAGQEGAAGTTTTITTITTTIITTVAPITPQDLDERVRLFLERRQNMG